MPGRTLCGLVVCLLSSFAWATPPETAVPDPQPGEAAAHPNPPDADRADEVIIVTGRRLSSAFESPQGTNVVDEQRMQELQPRSTAEALRSQPGVWVQQTGHSGGAPIIRGFMGNRVVYLFDGVRRNTASIFSGPNGFLNYTDPMSVRRVEVVRGPGSVLYGSDAIGGVVNVISGAPVRFARDDAWHASGFAGSWYETVDSGLGVGGEVGLTGPDVMANIGGGHIGLGDVTGGGDLGPLEPSSYSQWGLDGQLALRLGQGYVEAFAQVFDRPDGTRYDRPTWESEASRQLYLVRYQSGSIGPLDGIEADAWYHTQSRSTDRGNRSSDGHDVSFGIEIRARQSLGPVDLIYGLHVHRDMIESSDTTAATDEMPAVTTRAPDAEWNNPAAFVMADYDVAPALTLTAGLRGDVFMLASQAPPANSVSEGLSPDDLAIDRSDFALTGGLGAVVRLSDAVNWLTHAGSALRAPGTSEYLESGEFTYGYKVPAPGPVSPERSFTVETGVALAGDRLEGSVMLFHTWLRDIIGSGRTQFAGSDYVDADRDGRVGAEEDADGDNVDGSDEEVYAASNLGQATALGAEIQARFWLTGQLSAYAGGAYVYGEVDSGEAGSVPQPLQRGFPMNGTLGLRWQDTRSEPRVWVEAEAHGAAPFDRIQAERAERDPAYLVDPQDSESGSILRVCDTANGDFEGCELPGFVLVNVRAGVRLVDHIQLTLNLENVTDQAYRVKDSRIDGPGFNARIGLRAEL